MVVSFKENMLLWIVMEQIKFNSLYLLQP